jgi:hypothetical protein
MPWIVKALLVLAKTRIGRKLLLAGGLAAIELARGDRARTLYGNARTAADGLFATAGRYRMRRDRR